MIIREVKIDSKNESKKKKIILENLGKEVILYDSHNEWCHGTILQKGYDEEVYKMKIEDFRGEQQLHYHDLNKLLVLRNI